MLRKPPVIAAAALALAALFLYGVAQLFILRYERGDVYPPYSTLRTDPLGAKGLYEALDRLPELSASRNFGPLPRLRPATPITLVYAGLAHRAYWENRELSSFNELVLGGTRAVFAFAPVEKRPRSADEVGADEAARRKKQEARSAKGKPKGGKLGAKAREAEKNAPADEKKPADDADEDDEEANRGMIHFKEVAGRWGFAFDYLPADEEREFDRVAVLADEKARLEPKVTWHTALFFKDLKPEWKVLYRCEGQPVVIERRLGRGSIVLAADSYFLSNEAMRNERHPQLLAHLFNGPPALVFDEEHLGVRDDPGIASLARKYRLHGVVAGVLVIALLFVWKNAARFIPPYHDETRDGDIVLGKDSAGGFINLLRRTIKPADILPLCLAELRKSTPLRPAEQARVAELAAQEQARPSTQRSPVATYQAIAQTLTRGRPQILSPKS
jgi:hypothetical protein